MKTIVTITLLFLCTLAYSQDYVQDTLSNTSRGLVIRFIPTADTSFVNEQIAQKLDEIEIYEQQIEQAKEQIKLIKKELDKLEKAKIKDKAKIESLGYKEKYR